MDVVAELDTLCYRLNRTSFVSLVGDRALLRQSEPHAATVHAPGRTDGDNAGTSGRIMEVERQNIAILDLARTIMLRMDHGMH